MKWLLLVLSLPGKKSSGARVKVWRSLKSSGAVILRDGVYLLPDTSGHKSFFDGLRESVNDQNGSGYVVAWKSQSTEEKELVSLFDRSERYREWLEELYSLDKNIPEFDQIVIRKLENTLRKSLSTIAAQDFFPGNTQLEAVQAMDAVSKKINQRFSADEPIAVSKQLNKLDKQLFQRKTWVTRADMWIDRVASAWLIQRFIDDQAQFKWIQTVEKLSDKLIGFDFDGAEFSHVGEMVTFEVLVHSFGLEQIAGLKTMSRLVHYLDVGGVPRAEADGVLSILGGMKVNSNSDAEFLGLCQPVFDSLYSSYSREVDE